MQDSAEMVASAVGGLPMVMIVPGGDAFIIWSSKQFRRLFLCSSQTLISTCGHFRKKLAEGSQPHMELMRDKKVYLTIGEFDPKAVDAILNLIHGRTRNVPEKPALPLLLEFARFCAKIDCLPSVESFAKSWIDNHKNSIIASSVINENTRAWLFIALTFRHQPAFRLMTAIFKQRLSDRWNLSRRKNEPPIPHPIIEVVNEDRERYLRRLVELLYDHHKRVSGSPPVCTSRCDRAYSDMMIEISASDLLPFFPHNRPDRRFQGYVARDIRLKLLRISDDSFLLRNCPQGRGALCPNLQHPLGLDVENHLKQFTTVLCGLDLPNQK